MYGLGMPELILMLAAILLLIFSNKLPALIRDMERQGG
jgi:Sec-independent protein translocase protein TatA